MAITRPGKDVPNFEQFRKRRTAKADFLGSVSPTDKSPENDNEVRIQTSDLKTPQKVSNNSRKTVNQLASVNPGRKSVILKAWVNFPAKGHSKIFDQAAIAYGNKVALQLILKAALTAYDAAMRSDTLPEPLTNYPKGQGGLKVSRTISSEAFEQAKAIVDPLGMLPTGTLAATICRNALAYHFKPK